jgi:hypothetical protein
MVIKISVQNGILLQSADASQRAYLGWHCAGPAKPYKPLQELERGFAY